MSSEVGRRLDLYGFEYRDDGDQRRKDPEERSFNIKQLWQRSHEIINLAVRGMKNVEIAEFMGVTPVTVSNILNSELGMRKMSELRQARDEEVKKDVARIRHLTDKALSFYNKALTNEHGEIDLKTQKEVADTVVLQLSGLRAPDKSVSIHLTSDELNEFKKRGMEAAMEAGFIDVTPEENDSGKV